MSDEPVPKVSIRELRTKLMAVLEKGTIVYGKHVIGRADERKLSVQDIENLLRAGQIRDGTQDDAGCWRYQVFTERMYVVVLFLSDGRLLVKTAVRTGL